MKIRQPIVTVAGHVDHGKTTLLDNLRETSIAEKESGNITQKISFTLFPSEQIKKSCYLIDKQGIKLKIPGFLFIDTPGHQAFTNLRKRGGSLADLAILVIDINEGIKPQTSEVLQILKKNKTPFIIALNKIDKISGWKKSKSDLKQGIESQALRTKQNFDEKLYTLIGSLNSYGFNADLFFNISDFTKKVAIVPISASNLEGVPELLMVLCGLSQKYLTSQLRLGEKAKGVIFEIKKQKSLNYVEAILYDGKLKSGDEIAISTFDKPIISKIRVLEEIIPLSNKFKNKQEITAATGIRIQTSNTEKILPGMPFIIYENNLKQIEKEFKKQIQESIQTENKGIIVKADSLGSLEAILTLLKQNHIKVLKANIGNISKSDVISAKSNLEQEKENAVILGFNVCLENEVKLEDKSINVLTGKVVYKLIEDLQKWQENKRKEIERGKLAELSSLFKIQILHQHIFRNSNPSIFGVKVLAGKLKSQIPVINTKEENIGKIKNIQSENKSVEKASEGSEVAISIPGVNFERQLQEEKYLYSDLTSSQFKKFKQNKDLLTESEKSILEEIVQIKRQKNSSWGL